MGRTKVAVKNCIFADGEPKICVPLVGRSTEGIFDHAERILSEAHRLEAMYPGMRVDVIEFRADYYDNVVFVGCTMGSVIAPAGWHTSPVPNPSTPSASSGWREWGSVDPSGKPVTGHNASGLVLTDSEAAPFSSREAVLGW